MRFLTKKKIIILLIDVLLAAALVLGTWWFQYVMPHGGVKEKQFTKNSLAENFQQSGTNVIKTEILRDDRDWHEKFKDKFADHVISTENTYKSPNLSVTLSYHTYDSSKLDRSAGGNHEKYGTKISYVLADIYIGDITCFQTGFAQNMYGTGYSEKLGDMSQRMKAILSINGDSYSNNRHRNSGTIIRNGALYRKMKTDMETCVLNWDGTMDIYTPEQLSYKTLAENGAYQSWVFGPSLLDENGKAKSEFLTWDYIRQAHPRTAIGYYEPGHYCFLVVDGRQTDYSRGMFLEEMAKLFEDLGCKAAYNLDGGHCSFMLSQDKMVSHPYRPEHEISDGIFITEGLYQ